MKEIFSFLSQVDSIEGFNARTITQDANVTALLFAIEHDIAITAGSDAQFASKLGWYQ